MLQGVRAALHKGTVVYFTELAPVPLRATVQTHDKFLRGARGEFNFTNGNGFATPATV